MALNNIVPVYYRISIDPTGLGGLAPADGFIDNTKSEEYENMPSTKDAALAKERANIRWRTIVQKLSENIAPTHVIDFNKPGANHDNPPTLFEFTVVYDREEYVYTYDETLSEPKNGDLKDTAALKRLVARALHTELEVNTQYYDPSTRNGQVIGLVIEIISVGKLHSDLSTLEGQITVTKVDHTG